MHGEKTKLSWRNRIGNEVNNFCVNKIFQDFRYGAQQWYKSIVARFWLVSWFVDWCYEMNPAFIGSNMFGQRQAKTGGAQRLKYSISIPYGQCRRYPWILLHLMRQAMKTHPMSHQTKPGPDMGFGSSLSSGRGKWLVVKIERKRWLKREALSQLEVACWVPSLT